MVKAFLSVENREKVLDLYHTSGQGQRDQIETLFTTNGRGFESCFLHSKDKS